MISLNSTPHFGGHHEKPGEKPGQFPNDLGASSQSAYHAVRRMPRSTGTLGSDLSLASFQSYSTNHRHSSQGNAWRQANRHSRFDPKASLKKPTGARLNMEAYQQLLDNSLTYRLTVDQFAQGMSKQILDWRPRAQGLLTQIRSAEIDPQGADLILNNFNRATEVLEDVQRNLDYVINQHHAVLKIVRQDPRFDRKA